MLTRTPIKRTFSAGDTLILLLIGTVIFGVIQLGRQWHAELQPVSEIDLSLAALPKYAFLSAIRGFVAYLISLSFTFVIGYAAARSKRAERIIVPMLDILQSIPVLGFLPGLVLGLIAIFPRTNTGLELAAILMIFTGQVWNMTFAFYASLKSIPADMMEASNVIGLNWKQRLTQVEFPFSAVTLAWNSLLSMAGGWFFLSVCEAFTLGKQNYRLPGVGAYIAVASSEGNVRAIVFGMLAMVTIIVAMDAILWRPILVWVQRFRLEDRPDSAPPHESFIRLIFRDSNMLRWIRFFVRKRIKKHHRKQEKAPVLAPASVPLSLPRQILRERFLSKTGRARLWQAALAAGFVFFALGSVRLLHLIHGIEWTLWLTLIRDSAYTFWRVAGAVILSSLWTVPLGVWIARSPRRLRIAQPVVQILASFPAPMLYPVALGLFLVLRLNFEFGSMLLMLLGVQWYILFNVIAGALRIPRELEDLLKLTNVSRWTRWKTLYIPSIFPALVTGWVTAAGGAWNASIVAEYLSYKGNIHSASGLGATISDAAARGDFKLLAASITVMVVLVILINRLLWSRLYSLAQVRFRMG